MNSTLTYLSACNITILAVTRAVKMKFLLIICYTSIQISLVLSAEPRVDPLVLIQQGIVRGHRESDGDYSTFLGIPYAHVDLDNPFGPAAPLSGFQGVFNAYDASMKCPQNPDSEETLDCLRLNIYVPNKASSLNPLPVLVWVHGGGFAFGSGAEFNPAKLVRHGIVVVTINYRLGPYGFMCLDVPSVPGNQGIKDQFEALRWIRNNIAAFGGNPYQVTLAGESAGSACVLYHLYSSNQKLYNKVIVQSDTPQNEGMFVQKDTNAALKLAEQLGLNTSDTEEALRFLANISPKLVIGATRQLNLQLKPCKENVFNGVDNIITSDPLSLSNLRKVQNTPVLIGHTTREHLGVLLEMYGSDYLNKDPFYEKLKNHFNLDDEELDKVAKIVRHFYIGDEPVSVDVLAELEDFDSDFVFNHPVQSTINNLLNENANAVYEYLFSYVGDSGAVATGHAAENDYLFVSSELDQSEDDELIVDRITALWSNFVKFGNPTPEATSLLPVSWKPVSRDARPYLVIDTDMRLQSRVFKGRMSFWDLFYAIYGSYDRFIDE